MPLGGCYAAVAARRPAPSATSASSRHRRCRTRRRRQGRVDGIAAGAAVPTAGSAGRSLLGGTHRTADCRNAGVQTGHRPLGPCDGCGQRWKGATHDRRQRARRAAPCGAVRSWPPRGVATPQLARPDPATGEQNPSSRAGLAAGLAGAAAIAAVVMLSGSPGAARPSGRCTHRQRPGVPPCHLGPSDHADSSACQRPPWPWRASLPAAGQPN